MSSPSAIAVNPATSWIYAANWTANVVTAFYGAPDTIRDQKDTAIVPTGIHPNTIAVNPVTNRIYVTNHGSANVTVIDGTTNTFLDSIATGAYSTAIAVNPVTNKIYVTSSTSSDKVTVIDGSTNDTTSVVVGIFLTAIAVNPATNKIYASSSSAYSGKVYVIDGANNNVVTLSVGHYPWAITLNPVTNKIYVANKGDSSVTVIDGITNATTKVHAGVEPYGVAVNPVTNKIYVANHGSANVTVIDGATNSTTTVGAGTNPYAITVNPVTDKIYVANDGSANITVIDDVPVVNSRVLTTADTLWHNLAYSPMPTVIGKAVNKLTPYNSNIGGVVWSLGSGQKSWHLTNIINGAGSDSVSWMINWGSESLMKGENFVLAMALGSDASTTNNLGLGTPFVGNLKVYPLYYIDSPPTEVKKHETSMPAVFSLHQNYPNPFNPITTIEFTLAKNGNVRLKVYDLLGREIATLVNEEMKAGVLHKVPFDGSRFASGIYFYRLEAGENVQVKKLMLLK
jgi:YVTN family beta-propeller protein